MLGALIGAGANLIGGMLGRSAQQEANETAQRNADRNIALQKEFAQTGIQWKVEDAKKAGIHPLYALGASTTSFSPVSVGSVPETGLASGIAAAGQDISRAVQATQNAPDRASAVVKTVQDLQIANMGLQNELLATQIAKQRSQIGPPMPVGQRYLLDGQGQTASGPLVKDEELKRVSSDPLNPSSEPGAITDVGYARTQDGWAPVPSKDVKERIEDNIIQEVMHAVRNNIIPSLGFNYNPPRGVQLKDGERWHYNAFKQQYEIVRDGLVRTKPY